MKFLGKLLLALAGLAVLLAAGAISLNGVPITAQPGIGKRLFSYLTRNEAVMGPDHEFPELRPRSYTPAPAELFETVRQAVVDLGWQIQSFDPAKFRLHAVVTTSMMRFKDDVNITVSALDSGSSLSARSASRVGRADFGANLSHIIKLQRALAGLEQNQSG